MKDLALKATAWAQTRRQPREEGQTVIEYALVVALVSVVLAVAIVGFGNTIITKAQSVVSGKIV